MKKVLIYSSMVIAMGCFVFYGCKKEQSTANDPTDTDTRAAEDNSLAEGTFNDVNNIAGQAVQYGTLATYKLSHDASSLLSSCATVTVYDTSGHGTITIDFGATPCLCLDLRYRQGIINIQYSGMYRDSGSVITITFNNYYVGWAQASMYKVMGTKVVRNTGHNAAGHTVFSIDVNGSLLNTSGQTMSWVSQRQREWIAGESTTGIGNWQDDEYKITGSASGTTFYGSTYTVVITQPLHVALNCRWIEDGKFDLTPNGKPTRSVDFGSGCDNRATVTINGFSFQVILR